MKHALSLWALLGLFSCGAEASLPAEQLIQYSLREIPTDPLSKVTWTVLLHLQPTNVDGNCVSWHITAARFRHLDGDPSSGDVEWQDHALAVSTARWEVCHHDPRQPQAQEFAEIPPLEGIADGRQSASELHYCLSGTRYTAQPQLFEGRTAALTYSLLHRSADEQEEEPQEGEDEPAEIDPINDPD